VNSANFFGSVARILPSRSSRIAKVSSHEIGSNSPAPRSEPALRRNGWVNRAGEYCFMMPLDPLAQSTPWFNGWSILPSMKRTSPFFRCTLMPQRQAHI